MKNNNYLILFFIFIFTSQLFAQEKDTTTVPKLWTRGINFSINATQTSLTNWAAGGQNSFAWNAGSNSFINYKKNKLSWSNSLELAYGMLGAPNAKNTEEFEFRKTDDKVVLESKLSYEKNKRLKYSLLFDFRTQMTEGYAYPTDSTREVVSKFLAPAFSLLAAGLEYNASKSLYIFLSPVTMKTTLVLDDTLVQRGSFGVQPEIINPLTNEVIPGKKIRFEPGAYLTIKYNKEVAKNTTIKSSINLFEAYIRKDYVTDKYVANGNIDVLWDFQLLMKLNKYFTASLSTSLIYDDDIKVVRSKYANDLTNPKRVGPAIQFRQILALGFMLDAKSQTTIPKK